MKLITAILTHIWLALRLKHDGTGMPTKFPAAFMLIILYVMLNLANKHNNGGINLETVIALSFIAHFYLFSLRTKLIGLFIVISVFTNAVSLMLTTLAHIPEQKLFMLLIMEYIMIFAALINVIKNKTEII
jgi:hypothetical protein